MLDIAVVSITAFAAGFIDSIAGGGGLIQVPMLLITFPNLPVATLLGTNKLASTLGTLVAAIRYQQRLRFNYRTLIMPILVTFGCALLGTQSVVFLHDDYVRPLIIILLGLVWVYTFIKKDFGKYASIHEASTIPNTQYLLLIVGIIGFYDGFLGPGTGSFLMFAMVLILGMNLLQSVGLAKIINLTANCAALLLFLLHQHVIFKIGLPMMVCNVLGNYIGSSLAIKKGQQFIRTFFLIVVFAILSKLLWDMMWS
ncbi:MAG: TSUP family transporter [Gammaproteobacteria bacterium]